MKKLRVIPKPKEGTKKVWQKEEEEEEEGKGAVLFMGSGDLDFECGKCDAILLEGVEEGELRDVVFLCDVCGSYNEIPMNESLIKLRQEIHRLSKRVDTLEKWKKYQEKYKDISTEGK